MGFEKRNDEASVREAIYRSANRRLAFDLRISNNMVKKAWAEFKEEASKHGDIIRNQFEYLMYEWNYVVLDYLSDEERPKASFGEYLREVQPWNR